MRRILLAAACLLATAMPAVSQTLRISLRQDLDNLDPTLTTSYVARIVLAGLCDKLFDIDEKLHIVPQLATGYEWSDDRTLVIHLRSGVTIPRRRDDGCGGGEVLAGAPPHAAGQLPQERDQLDRSRRSRRSLNGAHRAEEPVRRIPGATHGSFRHDLSAEGDRGGGQGLRLASGMFRPLQLRRARGAGSRDAGAVPAVLGCEGHSLRQGGVSGPAGQFGAARQPAGRHHRYHGIPGADRRRRGEGGSAV